MEEVVFSLNEREFKRSYRMDKPTFRFVLYRVRPYLEEAQKSNHREDEIDPAVVLAVTLTWLRGGRYLDAARIHRIRARGRAIRHPRGGPETRPRRGRGWTPTRQPANP
jgi:hypothetical protein